MRKISRYLNIFFLTLLAALSSCRDELWLEYPDIPEEGLPASVSLKVNVGGTKPGTRYAGFVPGDSETSAVDDLWVGLFRVSDGSLITSTTYKDIGITGEHVNFGTIELKNIPAASGQCYIVAVANTLSNDGVLIEDTGSAESKKLISDLLKDVTTLKDFRKISVLLSNPQSVSRVSADFPMCGSYLASGFSDDHGEILDDEGNPEIVNIYPGENDLPGSVHLQRLDSYIKFILNPGENVKITPVSWQVKNLPSTSFLLERKSVNSGEGAPLINAADTPKKGTYWRDEGITTNYFYNDSQVYLANTFIKERDGNAPNGSYSFDFYQMENKHTGIIDPQEISSDMVVYHEREREFKDPEPTMGPENELLHDPNERNTGWYKSLVKEKGTAIPAKPSSDADFRNNNATFLELHVQVEYYYENKGNDTNYEPVDPANYTGEDAERLVQRVANAIYNIHLGYVTYNQEEPADVNDFNCYRNSNVTYNLTIYGADHIRVEAQENSEITSSVEGTVTDIEASFFNLDCHYSVFQIELNDKERKDLTWRIRAPYGDDYIDMVNGPNLDGFYSSMVTNLGDGKHGEMIENLPKNQFYNWVHIVPSDDGKIPPYPGDPRLLERRDLPSEYSIGNIKGNSPEGVWYLEDLRDIDNFVHPDRNKDGNTEDTRLSYTVFIDEYVYDFDYDPGSSTLTSFQPMDPIQWQNYVNQDYRKLWIRLGDPNLSYDGESVYSQSLYMMAQESIQTYYNTSAPNCAGLEHINESYNGTKFDYIGYNEISPDDGLQNLYNYVSQKVIDKSWSNVVGNENQSGKAHDGLGFKDTTFPVRKHSHNYMEAALARNRDLNGNGTIENFELRWYLPPVSTYTRMMIGAGSLKTPLFHMLDFKREEEDIKAGTGTVYTHYVSSDNMTLWAEELAATGNFEKGNPGTLRCIRNVGVPVSDSSPIQNMMVAYQYDSETGIVTMKYYRTSSLRPETRGHLPSHYAGSVQSYPAYSFQVAAEDCIPLNDEGGNTRDIFKGTYLFPNVNGIIEQTKYSIDDWTKSVNSNAICGGYAEADDRSDEGEWRMPNISEITIMAFLGILDGKNYRSCTREYFSGQNYRYMGMNQSKEITAGIDKDFYVRAVRDVMQ